MKFTSFLSAEGLFTFYLNGYEKTGYQGLLFYSGEPAVLRVVYRGDAQFDYFMVVIQDYTFYTDYEGNLTVDITQFLQTLNGGAVNLRIKVLGDDGEYLDEFEGLTGNDYTTCTLIQGIAPDEYAKLLPPCDKLGKIPSGVVGLGILPPNVIYKDTIFGVGTCWQVFDSFNGIVRYAAINDAGKQDFVTNVNNSITIPADVWSLAVIQIAPRFGMLTQWQFREPEACKNYIMLQWAALAGTSIDKWTSTAGAHCMKRAIFEVEKTTIVQEGAKAMSVFGDGYRNDITQSVVLSCKIDGLTAYGYAYYSDLLVSPKVNAILSAGEDLNDETTEVVVDGGKAEITNSAKSYTLRFNIKYKHYANKYRW